MPRLPNILVTGTPGTGKTTMCQMITVRSRHLRCLSAVD